jgi:predicted metal-dependent hydrolase
MAKIENIVIYSDLGEVRFSRNRRARNLAIRINQQGEVRVTVPGRVSQRRAEAFLLSKSRWILGKLKELEASGRKGRMLQKGEVLNVKGKTYVIDLKREGEDVEAFIWNILLKEAKEILPPRVRELADFHGFKVSGVKVRRMKTRWGSCTAKNGINLNSWLVMLPDHLIDYVILHELVHTRHRDHSPRFWETLDLITPTSSKLLRKEIRNQRIMSF